MTVKIDDFDAGLGIRTLVHEVDQKLVFEKRWDAEPMLKAADELRTESRGRRWGAMEQHHVGFIPMAVLGTFMRQDGGFDTKRVKEWLRENPAFCTREAYLKVHTKGAA